jgi:effector-binding domain-containing protein
MFKIGEFANFIKIPVKTLRYYDEIGIFRPIKVDDETGYRYYSAIQLPLLNRILSLKDIGFSLSQISYVLENNLPSKELIDMLNLKDMELTESIRVEQERKTRISSLVKILNEEETNLKYDVIVKEAASIKAACLRDTVSNYGDQGHLWGELAEHIKINNSRILPGCMVIYYDPGFKESQVDLEVAEIVSNPVPDTDRIKYRKIEGCTMASAIHKGPYDNFSAAYSAILRWIEENGYTPCGPNREIYLEGEWSQKFPDDYITEIQIPIMKR